MAEKPIHNCEVRFQFKCPKQWDSLQETADPRVRSCSQCQKPVYLCQSSQEAAEHARAGHCIAVPRGVIAPKSSSDDFEQVLALAQLHGVPAVRLRDFPLDEEIIKLVSLSLARKHQLVPLSRSGSALVVAMAELTNAHAVDEVKFLTGYNVNVVAASRGEIEEVLARLEREDRSHMEVGVVACDPEPEPSPVDVPIARLLHVVVSNAARQQASQVRIEATGSSLVVHYELVGSLEEVMRPPARLSTALMEHLRRISGAGPDQDGLLEVEVEGGRFHYRVRIHSTASGEEAVLQLEEEPKRSGLC